MRTSRRRTSRGTRPRSLDACLSVVAAAEAWYDADLHRESEDPDAHHHVLLDFERRDSAEALRTAIEAWRHPVARNAPKRARLSEMEVWNAIGAVRIAGPRGHAREILPPGVAAEFKRLPPGLYKYGWGRGQSPSFTKFSTPSLLGAMTSTRIGASKVGEYHWLVDNFDPNYPVVVRGIDDRGQTFFRVEEYAKLLLDAERKYAVVRGRKTKRLRSNR